MPITKSAQKALRQSVMRRIGNIQKKEAFRSLVKKFRKDISKKDFETAKTLLPKIYQALDKAAKTSVIKKNTASRLKSRLSISLGRAIK